MAATTSIRSATRISKTQRPDDHEREIDRLDAATRAG
jgi:hypothetical protein